jgi:hypothetical protein
LLAATSAVLHGVSLAHATNVVATVLMVAMIAIHLPMPAQHHHPTGLGAALPAHDSTVMVLATALAAVEVTVAAAVLYYRTRALRTAPIRRRCPT